MGNFNYRAGEHNIVEMDINFTCVNYESEKINEIAETFLKNHEILMNSLNLNK